MKTANFLRMLDGFNGDARLFELSHPLAYRIWNSETKSDETHLTSYVAVSATSTFETETYIFPCDSTGKVTNWGELPSSYRGGLDATRALKGAGYEAVVDPSLFN
jgi:hypothetical protein